MKFWSNSYHLIQSAFPTNFTFHIVLEFDSSNSLIHGELLFDCLYSVYFQSYFINSILQIATRVVNNANGTMSGFHLKPLI